MKKFYLSLLAFVFVSSCGNDRSELVFDDTGKYNSLNADTSVSFEQVKSEILVPKCLSCHGSVVQTEGTLQKWITPGSPEQSLLFKKVKDGSMPKNGSPLSSRDLELVRLYIEQLVEKPSIPSEPTPVAPLPVSGEKVSFSLIKSRILEPNCMSCHSTNIANEESLNRWITPGSPERSVLYLKVEDGSMPRGGTPLSAENIDLIRSYIEQMSSGSTPPVPDTNMPGPVTFQKVKEIVLEPYRCASCHRIERESQLDDWISESNPEKSELYTMVKSGQMPRGGPTVSQKHQEYLLKYIKDYAVRKKR